jgi:hypothetical protein
LAEQHNKLDNRLGDIFAIVFTQPWQAALVEKKHKFAVI